MISICNQKKKKEGEGIELKNGAGGVRGAAKAKERALCLEVLEVGGVPQGPLWSGFESQMGLCNLGRTVHPPLIQE